MRAIGSQDETMKAIVQEKYGSPEDLELREVDKPVAGDDEVLVRVRAASVHPDVWHVVSGRPYVLRLMGAGFSKPKNPIPGTDMAGNVECLCRGGTPRRPGGPGARESLRPPPWGDPGAPAPNISLPPPR